MDERLRETLSAMMDDEADELSVRRLLSHSDQDDVRGQWQRWQQVRDLMHENHGPAEAVDVAGAVREALDGQIRSESSAKTLQVPVGSYWRWPVAAMVVMALVIGFGVGAGWDSQPVDLSPSVAMSEAPGDQALVLSAAVEEVALQKLDEEQLQQMRQYLLEHAQHNSVGAGRGSVGYARLVSASGGY
ncbi:sigma-E factor negative regulatory protein [Marinobacter sp.]|uniref:sigma-E factor negative regulatory protein n=1 Tax=Marinobacter sp. TaxID=50741 RepID=UPI0019E2D8F4|nr:sigma-E factor negative regulatory protein [Marinobacter sp.]MBE0485207.1 sigma-E factor negative regulatory protein [Marinobacter sp.]